MTKSTIETCTMDLDFSDTSEIGNWRTVLDGVMGGRSSGTRFADGDHMAFRGTLNTNGGGFASIRRDVAPGTMAGATALRLLIRPDGRDYRLTFRTDERHRGRPVSYQVPVPNAPEGSWSEVIVPLSSFQTSVFGETVPAGAFASSQVREIGIIIADGVDGPFALDVERIACT